MLRFFRIIRRKLIEEDNMRKYIWYAVGEILLVMIGILLALQINNWNEANKLQQVEISYLEKLKEEFQFNLRSFENHNKTLQQYYERHKNLLNLYQHGSHFGVLETLIAIETSGFTAEVDINRYVWEDIYSTGNALIFQNEELQSNISVFYSATGRYSRLIEDLDSYRIEHRKMAQGVIPADFRVEMIEAMIDQNTFTQNSLEIEVPFDINEVVQRYREIRNVDAILADMLMVTDVAIRFNTNFRDNPDNGIIAIIDEIEAEILKLKN